MPAHTIVVVGSGPGIALQAALLFVSKGFSHITLISRTQANLDKTKSTLTSAHPTVAVSTYACDVSDSAALSQTLKTITEDLHGPPEVILFNAANVLPSNMGEEQADRLVSDFKVTTAALYTVATTLFPQMAGLPNPTLLVTGGHIHHTPFAPFFSLSASKASQFNLSLSLAQVYGPQGMHVATVVVNGIVQGEDGEMGTKNIAGRLWEVFEKGKKGRKEGEMSVVEVGKVDDFMRMVGLLK